VSVGFRDKGFGDRVIKNKGRINGGPSLVLRFTSTVNIRSIERLSNAPSALIPEGVNSSLNL
jgi:hypothetical protein